MKKFNIIPKANMDLYRFGSSINSNTYNDVDLAIIYDKNIISIENALNYRKFLEEDLSDKFKSPIDILLLSKEEEKEAEFLSNAKHEVIYKTTH